VVIDLGTNGPMSGGQFNRLAGILAGVPRVVVVNVRVPRRWEGESNSSIESGVAGHAGWRLADWHRASGGPGILGTDGVHPTPNGAKVYARVIAEQLGGAPSRQPPPADNPPPNTPTTAPPPPTTSPPS